MKKMAVLWTLGVWVLICGVAWAQNPRQIGGFELGRKISDYGRMVKMNTALPIRYNEFLRQVEIADTPNFKSGLITYGNCAVPGRIVQIKLKYTDTSKSFYETLLKRYKQRFGEPTEYRGDTFQILIAWKWSFVDGDDRISLTLQHNTKDEEEKKGNSVKMTMINYMEEERKCHDQKQSNASQGIQKQKRKKQREKPNWDLLIPR